MGKSQRGSRIARQGDIGLHRVALTDRFVALLA
jgi:hypothetical protein